MKKLLFTFLTLFLLTPAFAQDETAAKKVAVYVTGDVDNSYKKVLGSRMVSEFAKSNAYVAVERTADFLSALASEHDYQTSGAVQDNQIVSIGRQFGVRYVAVIDVSELFDELFVAARIIDVQTGRIDKSCEVTGTAESMKQLIELSQNLAEGLMLGKEMILNMKFATEPIHLSLSVKDTNGNRFYVTKEQYTHIKGNLEGYTKEGIVVIAPDQRFIVDLRNQPGGSITEYDLNGFANRLPNFSQLKCIADLRDCLDDVLRLFGGEILFFDNNHSYWTNSSAQFYNTGNHRFFMFLNTDRSTYNVNNSTAYARCVTAI